MPRSVDSAFDQFRRNNVDLVPDDSDTAKSSRGYLYDQLREIHRSYPYPPRMFGFVPYGSFARKTKVRPLDDIDFLAQLDGSGLTVQPASGYLYGLWPNNDSAPLAEFKDTSGYISSIRILNRIRDGLANVPHYAKAEVRRSQEVVCLTLKSYSWTFDITPAIRVDHPTYYGGTPTLAYYLIPNGSGNWKRTNPHVDDDLIRRINTQHTISVPGLIRLMKYWNNRTHKPVLPSYYFENICLKSIDGTQQLTRYSEGVTRIFTNLPNHLLSSCPDPKGLGPNLDDGIDYETKRKVRAKVDDAKTTGLAAAMCEYSNNQRGAVGLWADVFGRGFPTYG